MPKATKALAIATLLTTAAAGPAMAAVHLTGQVEAGGGAVAQSGVTLWAASTAAPRMLAQVQTGSDGRFTIDSDQSVGDDAILYLVAAGGVPAVNKAGGDNKAAVFLAVLGNKPPAAVVVNEFTTVVSVWTATQFLDGTAIKGNPLGLRIAAANVPNFVDLETGGYGTAIQDALNSTQTPTMANFATLADLLAGCATRVTLDACGKLFTAATPPAGAAPTDTLGAAEAVARYPWHQPDALFTLLAQFYPVPKGRNLRPVPFMPYLNFTPSAWVLPLKFTGGGLSAPGKLMIDSQGNVWAGDNFLVGFQNQDALWAGHLSKFASDGQPLSPMTSGFTGGGVEGIGFGLAIDAHDNVWGTTYGSRAIVVFDKNGKPLSPPDGYTFNGRLGLMQGIIVVPNGDVWAVDIEKGQLVHIRQGDSSKGELLFQPRSGSPGGNPGRLAAPFHLAIDQQDRIWVTNAAADWVTRFPASDPSKAEIFKAGYSGSGLAIDSKGNVWITNRLGNSERGRAILGKMVETARAGGNIDPILVAGMVEQQAGPDGGSITILRPDGTEVPGSPLVGRGLAGPWAVAVDGNDHVWVSNFVNSSAGIVELCGARTETCPPGKKMGDAISPPAGYVGGGLQMQVDVDIDPAGNVWVSNNWQDYRSALGKVAEPLSTLGAGQGLVVFYGMAKPVRTPQIGPARPY